MADGKPIRFVLEIYPPGNTDTPLAKFESHEPFMAISRGDLINARTFATGESSGPGYRVVELEHVIWREEDNVPKHKILVFTEGV